MKGGDIMSKFFETISEEEINQVTTKGGKMSKQWCSAMIKDLMIETALCAATGNATFCNVMKGEEDLINKYCH